MRPVGEIRVVAIFLPGCMNQFEALQDELEGMGKFPVESRRDLPQHDAAGLVHNHFLQLAGSTERITSVGVRLAAIEAQERSGPVQGFLDESQAVTSLLARRIGHHWSSAPGVEAVLSKEGDVDLVAVVLLHGRHLSQQDHASLV